MNGTKGDYDDDAKLDQGAAYLLLDLLEIIAHGLFPVVCRHVALRCPLLAGNRPIITSFNDPKRTLKRDVYRPDYKHKQKRDCSAPLHACA